MSIGSFSVKNPVLINILSVAVIVLGLFSLLRLPREQFSEVPFYWVNIVVPYPGVSAEEIEKTVTVKIENEMQGMDKLKSVSSVTTEGASSVRVEFNDGISSEEFARLFQETRTRFAGIQLPEGTGTARIDDFSSADFLPVVEVVLSGEADYGVLRPLARELRDRLEALSQIADAALIGDRERRISVNLHKEYIDAYGISLDEVARAIGSANISVPAGSVSTGSREFVIRTSGGLVSAEDLRQVILRHTSSKGGGVLRVGDVADVSDGYDPKGVQARYDGRPAIVLRITKVPGGDSTRVVEQVKNEIAGFSRYMPVGVQIDLFGDSTVQIASSIAVLRSNALLGFAALLVILFLFLGLRNALMTALGIPVTLALTFLILELRGETLNTNTLFGLVLVLGLIVDHAIVIIENAYRLENQGLLRHDAAIRGTNQVVWPVAAATGTTIAAFLPLMILPGTIGRFLRVIPFVVSVALAASTLEALVFLPSHFADWPGGRKQNPGLLHGLFSHLQRRFSRLLARLYTRKKLWGAAAFLIPVLCFSLLPTVRQDLFSAEDFTLFYIDIDMPVGTPIEKTADFVAAYEARLLPLRGNGEVSSVVSSVGFRSSENTGISRSNTAQIIVDLTERKDGRRRSITAIMGETQQMLKDIPGAENVRFRKAVNGPPVSAPVSFRLFGNNYQELSESAGKISDRLAEYPELFNIRDNIESGTPEMRISVDLNRASRFGLSPAYIGSYLRSAVSGIKVAGFFRNNEQVDVIVDYAFEPGVGRIRQIEDMMIPAPDGRLIPFSSVASLREDAPLASIKRFDGKREVTIEASAYDKSGIREINSAIEQFFNRNISPDHLDMELRTGGEFADLDNLLVQIVRIFLIGLFLMYIILGTQFNSYSQPFLILAALPFAFAGVILFLVVSGTPFSTTVLYAGVALAGIAVNDAIVLISFINEKRSDGMETARAVQEAAATRMRPILLTSLTTIAGLAPTALGLGGWSVVWGPMASTIIFGLIFSTLTALVVIPLLYGILYDRVSSSGKSEG